MGLDDSTGLYSRGVVVILNGHLHHENTSPQPPSESITSCTCGLL